MRTSSFARNEQLDALSELATGGFLRIYTGPRPDSADAAVPTRAQLISEHRFSAPAFNGASNGGMTARAITDDVNAALTADPTWFRVLRSDAATVLWDGTCGGAGADLETPGTIQARSRVIIDKYTVRMLAGT